MRGPARGVFAAIATVVLMCVFAPLMLVATLGSGLRARRFNTDVLGRALGRLVLRAAGIRLEVRARERLRSTSPITDPRSTLSCSSRPVSPTPVIS